MLRAAAPIGTASLAGHITRSAQAARRAPLHRLCSPQDCAQSEAGAVGAPELFDSPKAGMRTHCNICIYGLIAAVGCSATSARWWVRQNPRKPSAIGLKQVPSGEQRSRRIPRSTWPKLSASLNQLTSQICSAHGLAQKKPL